MIEPAPATDDVVVGLISLKQAQLSVTSARKRKRFDAIVWSVSLLFTVLLLGRAHDDSHRWSVDPLVQVAATPSKSGGAGQTESAR